MHTSLELLLHLYHLYPLAPPDHTELMLVMLREVPERVDLDFVHISLLPGRMTCAGWLAYSALLPSLMGLREQKAADRPPRYYACVQLAPLLLRTPAHSLVGPPQL